MERLFTRFPKGAPGLGLFLLRALAGLLAANLAATTMLSLEVTAMGRTGLLLVTGALLLVGLWTPVVGLSFAATWVAVLSDQSRFDVCNLVGVSIGVSLSLLGPGAWSVDARIFGKKTISVGRSK